jgi:hypothetical protein
MPGLDPGIHAFQRSGRDEKVHYQKQNFLRTRIR